MDLQDDKKLLRNLDRKNHAYDKLLGELQSMIDGRGKGSEVAAELNDQFWEELETHKNRMTEQVARLKNVGDKDFEREYKQADSIYEAARNYLAKYK